MRNFSTFDWLSTKHTRLRFLLFATSIGVIWLAVYSSLAPIANWLTYDLFKLPAGAHLGESIAFFLYDVPKILLLLAGMVFLISLIRTYFSAEKTRALLSGRREGIGNALAAALGVVTPFCSCSAVPLFIGFVEAGIPLGVTFSFLVAAPLVNEIALIMLLGMFGWRIALLYLFSGLTIAVVAGIIIGRLRLERYVEDFVWQIKVESNSNLDAPTSSQRIRFAMQSTRAIVAKVWLFVVIGIAVGAGIHGYIPENALADLLGKESWWSVPVAVLLGIPLYSNAAGIIPVVNVLMDKGVAVGTALAFMMAVIGLSLPEMIILRRVLKPYLIVVFILILSLGIIFTGYMFNLVL